MVPTSKKKSVRPKAPSKAKTRTKTAKKARKAVKKASRKPTASRAAKKKIPRDPQTPKALVDFMMQGWKSPAKKAPGAIDGWRHYQRRRDALSTAFAGETLIIPTGHEKFRANDATFHFRPGSDFFYLTGNMEPDCVLVLTPKRGGHRHTLYVEPNPGRSSSTFFTDKHKGELWVGPRLGVPESKARFKVEDAAALEDLPKLLRKLKDGGKKFRLLRGMSDSVDKALPKQKKLDTELATYLSEARLCKDDFEIAKLERAAAATRRGFDDIVRILPTAKTEREVEAAFNARARIEGNDVGYNVIAAGGANACILHWTRNDCPLDHSELLLIDAGVEGDALYTADVTRTIPMSGKFSPAQREVYDLVRRAQVAAVDSVKPGADFLEPHREAMRVLTEGLVEMGLLKSVEHAMDPEHQFYRRYTLHGTSHMLGIDVHDCSHARPENYRYGQLQPGMVITVEPGLYFQKDDLTVPAKYRGIGVRIEDDVLVTKTGHRVLTDVPRDSHDVEAWMQGIWNEGRAARRAS